MINIKFESHNQLLDLDEGGRHRSCSILGFEMGWLL